MNFSMTSAPHLGHSMKEDSDSLGSVISKPYHTGMLP